MATVQAQPQTQALSPKELALDHCVPVLAIDSTHHGLEAENASVMADNLTRLNSLKALADSKGPLADQHGASLEQALDASQKPSYVALWDEVQQSNLATFARTRRLRDLDMLRRVYEASVRLRMGESVPAANSPDYPPYQILAQLRELLKSADHRPAKNPDECSIDLAFQAMEQNASRFLDGYMKQYPEAFRKSKTPAATASEQARKTQSTLNEMYVLYHYYMKDTSNLRYFNDVSQLMYEGVLADAAKSHDPRDIAALAEMGKARYVAQPAFMRKLMDFWLMIDDMSPAWDSAFASSSLNSLP
ncbi:MAG: hypothetical protein JOY60_13360 [Burkholderiaceae bacterium]|nr:hypothetical protein [Burkholderiaceae bacterium]